MARWLAGRSCRASKQIAPRDRRESPIDGDIRAGYITRNLVAEQHGNDLRHVVRSPGAAKRDVALDPLLHLAPQWAHEGMPDWVDQTEQTEQDADSTD